MKKNLFLAAMMAWGVMGQAEDYVEVGKPICVEGRQWVYEVQYKEYQSNGRPNTQQSKTSMIIEFKGDTIIDGQSYKKCWRKYGTNATIISDRYKDFFNEDRVREITDEPVVIGYCMDVLYPNNLDTFGGVSQLRVVYSDLYKKEMHDYNTGTYQIIPDNSELYVLWSVPMKCFMQNYGTGKAYDSKVSLNGFLNQIRLNDWERKYVFNFSACDTEDINGEPRLKLVGEANKIYSNYYSYWIDGIGYVFRTHGLGSEDRGGMASNLISPLGTYNDWSIETFLSHVVENGEIIYKTPDFQDWLVPVSNVNEVKVTSQDTGDDAYYNLQGQRMDNPTQGIYIHNGKKVVVK